MYEKKIIYNWEKNWLYMKVENDQRCWCDCHKLRQTNQITVLKVERFQMLPFDWTSFKISTSGFFWYENHSQTISNLYFASIVLPDQVIASQCKMSLNQQSTNQTKYEYLYYKIQIERKIHTLFHFLQNWTLMM